MSDDPLSALAAQVRRAQELHTPVSAALVPGADALERLKALMARGRDLSPAPASSGAPLPAALAALLAQGRAPWPSVEIALLDARRPPLDALAALLAGERAQLGQRAEPLARRRAASGAAPTQTPVQTPAPQDTRAPAVADELLGALAQAPLDGAVRAAVAGALARAIGDASARDAEALRAILRMVVLNRAD